LINRGYKFTGSVVFPIEIVLITAPTRSGVNDLRLARAINSLNKHTGEKAVLLTPAETNLRLFVD